MLLEKSYLQKLVELPSLSSGGRLNQSAPGQPWWIAIRNQGTGHDFQKSGQIDIHQPSILWLFRADHVQAQIPWSHHLIVREDLEEAGGNPAQRDAIVGATCDPANWSPPGVPAKKSGEQKSFEWMTHPSALPPHNSPSASPYRPASWRFGPTVPLETIQRPGCPNIESAGLRLIFS